MAATWRNINTLLWKGVATHSSSARLLTNNQNPSSIIYRCSLTSLTSSSCKLLPPINNKLTSAILTPSKPTNSNDCRLFHTNQLLQCCHKDGQTEKAPKFGEQMSLRLMNENGFLSWTRNSYLSAAVGATMLNGANDELAHHAGCFVLLVSAMNMAWGSACHLTNLMRIKDRIVMTRTVLFLNLLGTVVHALLWLFILMFYLHRYPKPNYKKEHGKPMCKKEL